MPPQHLRHLGVNDLERVHHHEALTHVDVADVVGNVLLFLPFGFLLAWLLPAGRRWLAVVCGLALSGLMEAVQSGFLPYRYGTLRDVATNTLGAALGWLVAVLVLRRSRA